MKGNYEKDSVISIRSDVHLRPRVQQLRRTELARRVESAQCLRSPHEVTYFAGTPWGKMRKEIMKKIQLILSVSLCVFGGMLLIAGFIAPPLGEIHHSVLIAFGEILTFSGSLIGIDYHYRYKE